MAMADEKSMLGREIEKCRIIRIEMRKEEEE